MKTILSFIIGLGFSIAAGAQDVTLHFTGTNKNRNLQAVLDGTSYYSNSVATTGGKKITISTLQPGNHTIGIYRTNNNRYNSGVTGASTNGKAIYSKTFVLRAGYDMDIAIRSNGQVSFTEKRNNNATVNTSMSAMSDAEFDKLLASVRSKWSQSSRISTVRSAFGATNNTVTNYFTTDQVGRMLTLITAEATRLELAKLVYPRVTDKANYRNLYELFNTQSYKDDLDLYLRNNGGTVSNTNTTYYGSRTPVSESTFTTLLQTVNNQYLQPGKVAVLKDAFNNASYYFTTAQLRQLITPISAEGDRLLLLKQSYPRVADATNFYTLNDLLYNQSSRAELDNYVKTGGTTSSSNYSNRVAVSDAAFSILEMKARLHFRQSSTVEEIRDAFGSATDYYTVGQIRQLLMLVSSEADRLALAKLAFHRVTDPTTYRQLDDLFTTQASRDELARYTAANWF